MKLYDLAELFKVLEIVQEKNTLCIIWVEMCVCDLSVLLNVSQSAISHQLKF